MFTKESVAQELKRIQDSVPPMIKKYSFVEKYKYPLPPQFAQEVIDDPNTSEEKRQMFKNLLDAGKFGVKQQIENPRILKMRDEYITREIKKAVKAGRLPNAKQAKELGINEL